MNHPLLSLDLTITFAQQRPILENARLEIEEGAIVALVGQSGSGKSSLALAILRLLDPRGGRVTGSVRWRGRELLGLTEREMRAVRGREISLILQSPASSLNPLLRIRTQFREAWLAHASGSWKAYEPELRALLQQVDLPADEGFLRRYPGQLSVGQAQRVLIAMAVMHRPALLIADEPMSALDASAQDEVHALLRRLNRERGMAILYISHDLWSVANFCHRVAILHEGRVVEEGSIERVFTAPAHPFARRLVASYHARSAR